MVAEFARIQFEWLWAELLRVQLRRIDAALEIVGEANAPAVNPAVAQVTGQRRIAMGGHIIELDLKIGVPKPVHPAREIVQDAAVERVTVQVQEVVAGADLPGTWSACHIAAAEVEVAMGNHAVEYAPR